jgi:hypothetical protein
MAWTESRASSDELQRCIRDLVALSTLPAAWQNYDISQIGSSTVAALISMLDADFVFITLPGPGNQSITELACNNPKLGPADPQACGYGWHGIGTVNLPLDNRGARRSIDCSTEPWDGTIFRFTLPSAGGAPDGD